MWVYFGSSFQTKPEAETVWTDLQGTCSTWTGARAQGDGGRPEPVTMTCSLFRSRTTVTVVVQVWPFLDCTVMFAPTSSKGKRAVKDLQPQLGRIEALAEELNHQAKLLRRDYREIAEVLRGV